MSDLADSNAIAVQLGPDALRAAIDNGIPLRLSEAPELHEWPQLISLSRPTLPILARHHIPGWAGEYAAACAAETETPFELAGAMVLTACAAAAARRLTIQVQPGYSEPCNLWMVAALPSGNRKSAVQRAASIPLLNWERDQAKTLEATIKRVSSERKTMEARLNQLRKDAAQAKDEEKAQKLAAEATQLELDLPDVPRIPQLWTSDATPERLGVLLADNDECLAWISSEGGVFDMLQGRYSNGIPNLDLVLKAHSGDAERVDRGSRPPVYLRSPRLSIGLSPQPDVLVGLAAKPGFRGRGLLARFLYLLPPSPLGYRNLTSAPVAHETRTAYEAAIRTMLDWPLAMSDEGPCTHRVHLTATAESVRMKFAQEIEQRMRPGNDMEHFTDFAGKAPGAAVRIAGVLHAIKHAHERPWEHLLTGETAVTAIEVMETVIRHSLTAFDLMGSDETIHRARKVWEWIERGRRTHFPERDVFNALRGTFKRMAELQPALRVLEERGYIHLEQQNSAGPGRKPSPLVIVRPEIVEGWS